MRLLFPCVLPLFPRVPLFPRFSSQPDLLFPYSLARSLQAVLASEAVSDDVSTVRSSILQQLVAIFSAPLPLLRRGEKDATVRTTTCDCSSSFLQSPCLVLRWYIYYIHMYTIAQLSASRDSVNVSPLLSVTLPLTTEIAVLFSFVFFLYIAHTVL